MGASEKVPTRFEQGGYFTWFEVLNIALEQKTPPVLTEGGELSLLAVPRLTGIYIIGYISKSGITLLLTHLTMFNASSFALSIPSGVFIQLSLFVVVSSAGQGYTLI